MSDLQPSDLKSWRKRHGLSQRQLAILSKLGVSTIVNVEAGYTVQNRVLTKLMQAIQRYEESLTNEEVGIVGLSDATSVTTSAEAESVEANTQSIDLRGWRKRHNLTQDKVAKLSGISRVTLMMIEAGGNKPYDLTLAKLRQAMREYDENPEKRLSMATEPIPVPHVVPIPATILPSDESSVSEFRPTDLKSWRRSHNLSLEKFSKLFGFGLTTIRRIETGDAKVEAQTLDKLIRAIREYESGTKLHLDISESMQPFKLSPSSIAFSTLELKAWRERFHLARPAFAKLAGVSLSAIKSEETGIHRIQKATLAKIIRAMKKVEADVPVAEVVSDMKIETIEPTSAPRVVSTSVPIHPKQESIVSDFQPTDLKSWRKRYNLSQGEFAELSGLGLSTITSIEAGSHKLRGQTLTKLIQAMKDVEAGSKPVTEAPPSQPPIPTVTPAPAVIEIPKIVRPVAATPIGLTNLDLELINRVLQMTPMEKLNLLEKMMGV